MYIPVVFIILSYAVNVVEFSSFVGCSAVNIPTGTYSYAPPCSFNPISTEISVFSKSSSIFATVSSILAETAEPSCNDSSLLEEFSYVIFFNPVLYHLPLIFNRALNVLEGLLIVFINSSETSLYIHYSCIINSSVSISFKEILS